MTNPVQAKQTVQDLAKKAASVAGQQFDTFEQDVEEQIGLRPAPASQNPQDPQAAKPQEDINKIQAVENRRKRDRMQALQTELTQIKGQMQKEEDRLRQIRDPQAAAPVEENTLPIPSSKKGRQMSGAPGANRAQKRQIEDLQTAERGRTPSQ